MDNIDKIVFHSICLSNPQQLADYELSMGQI